MKKCDKCDTGGSAVEPVAVSGGGRIGWFCWDCEYFMPGEGVTV